MIGEVVGDKMREDGLSCSTETGSQIITKE